MNHQPPTQLPFAFDAVPPEPEPPACDYDPRELTGLPIGMLHCPSCGDVVLAGMEHPPRDNWADLESFVAGAR